MLRLETSTGWWLVTHPDHAQLAGHFAAAWGNGTFASPSPREPVLHGIFAHDDGWAERDAAPQITRDGKPAAFSTELVGAYSAFEEIDLVAYLNVRRQAVQRVAQADPYAAILISMHTDNLLSARADRSTIRPDQLPWLDAFLVEQRTLQRALREQLLAQPTLHSLTPEDLTRDALSRNFRLLQACDNLSLLSCVDFGDPATLLHPLALNSGAMMEVRVRRSAERAFVLTPSPFPHSTHTFTLRARFVPIVRFGSAEILQQAFHAATVQELAVTITSGS